MHNANIQARSRFKILPACHRRSSRLIRDLLFAAALFGSTGAMLGLALAS